MALRDILVYVDNSKDAVRRLHLGVGLAARHGSRLTALYVREWDRSQRHASSSAENGLVSGTELDRLDSDIEASIDRAASDLRLTLDALAAGKLETEWRVVKGPSSDVVSQHARYADLCILGHYRTIDDEPNSYSFSEKLLFSSGRPSIFIPPDNTLKVLGQHIAIAWNSSRAAARAVNDALPLLEGAERVTVLTINPTEFIDRNGALPAERLIEHLKRHGASAQLIELEDIRSELIADTLQAKAKDLDADLMVAGAFGQPRLWERLMGGTTRDLLDDMRIPIMMSN